MIGVDSPIKAYSVWVVEPYDCLREETNPPTWELIYDPSDSMILGGVFSSLDIRNCKYEVVYDCWIPGTRFKNIRSGKIMEVYIEVTKKMINKCGGGKMIRSKKTLRWKEVKQTDQLELGIT